jgi:uncharacterized membrane protein YhhN
LLAAARRPRSLGPALALTGSWAGDIALLGDDDGAFRVGLGASLGAHAAYAASFAARGKRPKLLYVVPVAASTAVSIVIFGRLAGPLARPVRLYAFTIGTMAAAATTLRGPGAGRAVAGAATFIVSDSLLAAARFAFGPRWQRVADGGVMATYAVGQWLIHDGLRLHDLSRAVNSNSSVRSGVCQESLGT